MLHEAPQLAPEGALTCVDEALLFVLRHRQRLPLLPQTSATALPPPSSGRRRQQHVAAPAARKQQAKGRVQQRCDVAPPRQKRPARGSATNAPHAPITTACTMQLHRNCRPSWCHTSSPAVVRCDTSGLGAGAGAESAGGDDMAGELQRLSRANYAVQAAARPACRLSRGRAEGGRRWPLTLAAQCTR